MTIPIHEWWWNFIIAPVLVVFIVGFMGAIAKWVRDTSKNTAATNVQLGQMDTTIKIAFCRLDSHETRIDGHDLMFARLDGAGKLLPPKP